MRTVSGKTRGDPNRRAAAQSAIGGNHLPAKWLFLEVPRADDDELLGIDVFAEGLGDLLRRQLENRLLLRRFVSKSAADVHVRDDLRGDRIVGRAADLLALHEGLSGIRQLFVGRAVL